MATERKTGLPPIAGILAPTTPHRIDPPAVADEGQGGEAPAPAEAAAPDPKGPRVRRKRTSAATADKALEGRRLYLSEGVHFRLRMLAYQRGRKLSEVAEEILDRGLPKYDVNRVG